MSRKERRRVRERSNNWEPANEGRREKLPRTRNRPEVEKWLETYKQLMVAKEVPCESTGGQTDEDR